MELGQLEKVTHFYLWQNGLSGSIPKEPGVALVGTFVERVCYYYYLFFIWGEGAKRRQLPPTKTNKKKIHKPAPKLTPKQPPNSPKRPPNNPLTAAAAPAAGQ